jgi:hypothetical protein
VQKAHCEEDRLEEEGVQREREGGQAKALDPVVASAGGR